MGKILKTLAFLVFLAMGTGTAYAEVDCYSMMDTRPVARGMTFDPGNWEIGVIDGNQVVLNSYGVEGQPRSGRVAGQSRCEARDGTPVARHKTTGEVRFIQCGNPIVLVSGTAVNIRLARVATEVEYRDRIVPVQAAAQGCSRCDPYAALAATDYGPRIEDPVIQYANLLFQVASVWYIVDGFSDRGGDTPQGRGDGHGGTSGGVLPGGRRGDGFGGTSW